jgi:hypothetical protein
MLTWTYKYSELTIISSLYLYVLKTPIPRVILCFFKIHYIVVINYAYASKSTNLL